MKNLTIILLLSCGILCNAQAPLTALQLEASVEHIIYQSEDYSYSEAHVVLTGNSLNHIYQKDSLLQSQVNITILYSQNDSIKYYNKSRVSGPLCQTPENYFTIKRTAIPVPGTYDMKVIIQDVNATYSAIEHTEEIVVNTLAPGLSKPLLISSINKDFPENEMAKNGLILENLPNKFLDKNSSFLEFYIEMYKIDQEIPDNFILSYMVVDQDDDTGTKPLVIQHRNLKSEAFTPILLKMDLSEVPSGNYKLICLIRGRDLKEYFRVSTDFQRSNPFLNLQDSENALATITEYLDEEFVGKLSPEELRFSILSIAPLVDQTDGDLIKTTLENPDIKAQQLYLFNFWAERYPINPESAYQGYMDVAKAVNATFQSGFRNGIETDRGYIYLKYGQPNDIIKEYNEMDAFPYEIWFYDRLANNGNQSDVKFLFYNPSKTSNEFQLLHSNCVGEIQNPRWELELYRSVSSTQADGNRVRDNFGRDARRYFEN